MDKPCNLHKFGLKKTFAWWFLSPWLFFLFCFWLFPFFFSFYLAFTDYNPLNPHITSLVGWKNFCDLFRDDLFITALKNTLFFTLLMVPLSTVAGLFLALLVENEYLTKPTYKKKPLLVLSLVFLSLLLSFIHTNCFWLFLILISYLFLIKKPARRSSFFRASFFMPSIISLAVIAMLFKFLYAHNGLINLVLNTIKLGNLFRNWAGIKYGSSWLASPSIAMVLIVLMDVWASSGYYMLLYLAGLQNIPPEVKEAAIIDGAGSYKRLFYIILPYLRPITLFVIVINTIRSLQVFTEVYVMTEGGPMYSTTTVVYLVREMAFHRFRMGYASAMAYVLLVIIMLFSWLQSRFLGLKRGVGE